MSQQMALKSSMGAEYFICLGNNKAIIILIMIIKIKLYVTCFRESGKNMFLKDPESFLTNAQLPRKLS